MIRSKDIVDYFEVKLESLRPGVPVPFDLHLYFARNAHLVVWRRAGDMPTHDWIVGYQSRGVSTFWVHRDDQEIFKKYLTPDAAPEAEPELKVTVASGGLARKKAEAREVVPAPEREAREKSGPAPYLAVSLAPARTESGSFMSQIIRDESLGPEEKKNMIAEAARALLSLSASSPTLETQGKADELIRKTVQDILDVTTGETHHAVADIWRMADIDPELNHAVNVATYAVTFALAFGRIEPELIADIAMAGLLHDVGISQVSARIAAVPWKQMDPAMLREYAPHVEASVALVEEYAPGIPTRVKDIMQQHHEKFDGTGYPQRLKGFNVDDIAQILGMANVLDAVSNGLWDGVTRTLGETFDMLEKLETSRNFPEYFNPEVFAAVMRWIRSQGKGTELDSVAQVVSTQAKKVVKSKRQAAAA